MATFAELGLSEDALEAIETLGYETPTPIQEQAIPLALEGRDIIAAAKTGTGKTAAFALPGMDKLPHRAENQYGPFMLIVTPTRELANQIADTCMPIGKHTSHFVGTFVGGVAYDPQIKKLKRGLDVAIATPGRLIDLMERGAIDLGDVQMLVLDEADRMLDMGFWPQVERIVNATPQERQTMLFSATIDRSQDQTMFSMLNDPAIVEIAQRGETADTIDQYVINTTRRLKPELLNAFIKEKGGERVVVFTKTKGCADNCARRLDRIGIPTEAIHADRSQAQRTRALNAFREGRVNVMVATDVLARGIDVPEVDYVVNYDLPILPEDYVHRIGRTGRAGANGFAVSFVTPDTRNLLRSVQKFTGQAIPEMDFKAKESGFVPLDASDPRATNKRRFNDEDRDSKGSRKGKGKGDRRDGKGKKMRNRDIERSAERKKRMDAEAAGIEYVAPERHKSAKKPTLDERQSKAEAAFNAMFDRPNVEGEASRAEKKAKRAEKNGKRKDFKKRDDYGKRDDFKKERKGNFDKFSKDKKKGHDDGGDFTHEGFRRSKYRSFDGRDDKRRDERRSGKGKDYFTYDRDSKGGRGGKSFDNRGGKSFEGRSDKFDRKPYGKQDNRGTERDDHGKRDGFQKREGYGKPKGGKSGFKGEGRKSEGFNGERKGKGGFGGKKFGGSKPAGKGGYKGNGKPKGGKRY